MRINYSASAKARIREVRLIREAYANFSNFG
jgi:hypothetical protein